MLLDTSIQNIKGKFYTVIWRDPSFKTKQLSSHDIPTTYGYEVGIGLDHVMTKLPALPEHPKLEDAPLLYRYASEGLFIVGNHIRHEFSGPFEVQFPDFNLVETHPDRKVQITHAIDEEGNRVEIAIRKEP